jgi:two-component SAPR family response regulator
MEVPTLNSVNKAVIVDDNFLDIYLLQHIIETNRIAKEVISFNCPVKALEYFSEYHYTEEENGIIFLDLNMPILNGFEFLEKFNMLSDRMLNNFRVVIVTSSNSPGDLKLSQKFYNVVKYLLKPVKPYDIEQIIEIQV